MVVDEASKTEIEKARRVSQEEEKKAEKETFRAEISDATSRVSDPVKMYLKEMGCISLLSREGEVEIAKRIEAGENKALAALLDSCVGIEHIIELGEELKDSKIKLKDVINDLEDDDNFMHLGERKESLIRLIEGIAEFHEDIGLKRREISKRGCSDTKKKNLRPRSKRTRPRLWDW